MNKLRPPFPLMWAGATSASALPAFWWLGGPGVLLVAIAGILALIWRYDNWTGSCFMLTILVLIVVAVLLLLLFLLTLFR